MASLHAASVGEADNKVSHPRCLTLHSGLCPTFNGIHDSSSPASRSEAVVPAAMPTSQALGSQHLQDYLDAHRDSKVHLQTCSFMMAFFMQHGRIGIDA